MPSAPAVSSIQMMTLYFSVTVIGMGQTVVFAIIPMLGRELGLDLLVFDLPIIGRYEPKELAITSLTSISSLTFFIAAPYWGRRSDILGRKPVILIGLFGFSIGTIVFNQAASAGLAGVIGGFVLYLTLMVTRVLLVLVMSGTMPASSAYVVDTTTVANRTRGMGRMAAASQVGTLAGPALAYFAVISLLAPLYLHALVTMFAALLVWRMLPAQKTDTARLKSVSRLRYLDPRYRVYLAIGLVMYSTMGMVQQTLGFYFQDRLHLSAIESAQMFSMAMVVSSGAMLFAQLVIVQRWAVHPLKLLRLGLPFTMVGYLVLANAGELLSLGLGMAFFGFGVGLSSPGFNVTATLTVTPQEQGALAGLAASAAGMGFVIGPLVGGLLYSWSPTLTYWCAGLTLVPLFAFVMSLKLPPMPGH
jgi:MFS family permease